MAVEHDPAAVPSWGQAPRARTTKGSSIIDVWDLVKPPTNRRSVAKLDRFHLLTRTMKHGGRSTAGEATLGSAPTFVSPPLFA